MMFKDLMQNHLAYPDLLLQERTTMKMKILSLALEYSRMLNWPKPLLVSMSLICLPPDYH
jgi:hypothetical protein